MGRLLQAGLALLAVALLVAVFDFATNPSGSPVRSVLRTVVDESTKQFQQLTGRPTPPSPAVPPAPGTPAPPQPARRREPATATAPALTADPAPTPPNAPPGIAAAPEPPATAPSGLRQFYLPGRTASWTRFDIAVAAPVAIRAAGRISLGQTASGPAGVATLAARSGGTGGSLSIGADRPLPSAPYLALIGRVCSGEACSEPFLVGSDYVVCPTNVKLSGHLQLWTNNNVRVAGIRTAQAFSNAVGGYSFSVEPAPLTRCGDIERREPALAASADAQALAAGRTLEDRQFAVPSSQSAWKPFFLPMNMPLVVRASGAMRPRNGAPATGPEGIVVPATASWSYPGASDLVVDQDHRLFDPAMPYQALIGRLCGQTGCGAAFVVGRERLLCPSGRDTGWLELWINHIIQPTGLLGSRTTLSLDAFDLQTRVGEYRFTISRAPDGTCAGR